MGRKKGEGQIFTKNGKYYWQRKINGQRITKTLKARTQSAAEKEVVSLNFAALVQTEAEVALFAGRARGIISKSQDKLTFDQVYEKYLNSPKRNYCGEARLVLKKQAWNIFTTVMLSCGIKHAEQISEESIAAWFSTMQQRGIKNTSINHHLSAIKSIYNVIYPRNIFFDGIKKLPQTPEGAKPFSSSQVEAIWAAVDGEMPLQLMFRDEMKVLFRLVYFTGLRLKDCCLLEWQHIDFRRDLINCKPFKTVLSSGEIAWIPIHPDLKKLLKSLAMTSQYILPGIASRYSPEGSRSALKHDIYKVIDWALWENKQPGKRAPHVRHVCFHSFRHTVATNCAEAGVPEYYIQAVLGQKSVAVTRAYTHLSTAAMQQVINALTPSQEIKIENQNFSVNASALNVCFQVKSSWDYNQVSISDGIKNLQIKN